MAEQFAVYSDDKDTVSLAQVLVLGKALTAPWFQFTFVGGTTETIPDAGNVAPEASDKVVFYETGLSSGSGARTLKLPETPVDGQIIIIKDLNAGTSPLTIQRFDASDSVDGGAAYTLTYDNQAIMLRPAAVTAGVWAWSILAEKTKQPVWLQWGSFAVAADMSLEPTVWYPNVGASPPPYDLPSSAYSGSSLVIKAGRVQSFSAYVDLIGIDDLSVTVDLIKNGVVQMTLGPFDETTVSQMYSTNTGAFDVSPGDTLWVGCSNADAPTTGSLSLIMVAELLI